MEIFSKQELIDWLNQINAFTEKGSLTSRASILINKDKGLKESLKTLADTESDNPSEILYRILTEDFKDTCEVCGKKTQFQDFTRGYKKSCSKECSSLLTVSKGKATKERIYGDSSYNNLEKHKQTCLERYGKESYTNHSKAEETKLAKYGDPNYCNPLKNKQTCLERYGVESVTYLQSMKDKSKATSILKYGVDHPMKFKALKEDIKMRVLNSYGKKFPLNNKDAYKEIIKSKLIEDKAFCVNGTLNSSWLRLRSSNYDWDKLEGDSIPEKIYLLFNERPKCPICGKTPPFKSYSKGYQITCSQECKKEYDRQTLKANSYKLKDEAVNEKRRQTCLERYGVDNVNKCKATQEKAKSTNLKRYGTENVFSSEEIKNKIRNNCLSTFGVERYCQLEEVKQKIKDSNNSKYGGTGFQSKEIKDKAQTTIKEKYGVENYSSTNEFKQKFQETSINRYGETNPAKSQEVKDKIKETCILRYGVESTNSLPQVKNKIRNTCLTRYGVEYTSQIPSVKQKIFSHKGMTSPEKKINDFLSNNGFEYQYQYECNGKCFDFAIFKDNELSILVEVDGEYFHGLLSDCDGKLVRGDKDCERFSKCPEGVKLIVCDSFKVEDCFSEILRVFDIDYEKWIQEIVDSLPKEFPYYEYSEERMRKDYEKLCTYRDIKKNSRLGDSIISNFHRSIYDAHISTKPSPKEAWNNRELLEKCVRNRFIYSSNLSSHSILQGFNVCKIAPKVSVFSASLARRLIQTYLDKYNQIFDPFSGFSGRMLGACSLDKSYIGQDINVSHIKESKQIAEFLGLKNVSLKVQNILEDTKKEYECLFTCPPYGGKEHWNIKNDLIEKTCDEWIDECLNRFKCKTYLFVVDETEKYKDYIVEEISNSSHFGNNKEYVIRIDPHY